MPDSPEEHILSLLHSLEQSFDHYTHNWVICYITINMGDDALDFYLNHVDDYKLTMTADEIMKNLISCSSAVY